MTDFLLPDGGGLYRILVQGIVDYAVYMLDPDGIVLSWNPGAERAKGYQAHEIVGQGFDVFYDAEDRRAGVPRDVLARARDSGRFEGEGWRLRKDGTRFWAHVVVDAIRDDHGTLVGFAKITRDLTGQGRMADEADHPGHVLGLARHDTVPDPSHRSTIQEVLRAASEGRPPFRSAALLRIDLDRLDRLGPPDEAPGHRNDPSALDAVAARIRGQLRRHDVAARLGSHEFLVVAHDCADAAGAMALANRLLRAIGEPVFLASGLHTMGASIGIVLMTPHGLGAGTFVHRAGTALSETGREGRNRVRLYDPTMDAGPGERRGLERALRQTLAADGFDLHYQPIGDAAGGQTTGFEALLRWNSPDRGSVPPAAFIPFAEEIGLMPEIDAWVLGEACRTALAWPGQLSVSVNLSAASFRHPGLVGRITDALAETGLPAARLELEVTETATVEDLSAAAVILQELRLLGVGIALDDFGTGHSSLSLARTLPFTRLKIDRSFVRDLDSDPNAAAIVRAVCGLCRELGARTTAEGVETYDQAHRLRAEGCTDLQGYLIGRPMTADAVMNWLMATGFNET